MMRIRGEDLVAMEAKYHRGCYRRYAAAASSSKSTGSDKSIQAEYDSAFLKLVNEIEQKLVKEGRSYDTATLSGMYKRHLTDSGVEKAVVDTYEVQTLKRRLIQHYGKKIQFHQQYERNRSELVCSPSLNLAEIINLVVAGFLQNSVDGNESAHVMSMAFYQGVRRTLARSEDEH